VRWVLASTHFFHACRAWELATMSAAPVVMMTAAPVTTLAAAPVMHTPVTTVAAAPVAPIGYAPAPAQPVPPPDILSGHPHPNDIATQKAQYHKSIDGQLASAQSLLEQQHKHQLEYLAATIEQQKKDFNIQKEQEKAAQAAALTQQYTAQLHELQDAARMQRHQLEVQATQLHAEYQVKVAKQGLLHEQHQSEKKIYDATISLHQQMGQMQAQYGH